MLYLRWLVTGSVAGSLAGELESPPLSPCPRSKELCDALGWPSHPDRTDIPADTRAPRGAPTATVPSLPIRGRGNVPVSATLAANEALARRRERGEPVLPLAFGESGLPVHPRLTAELADMAGHGAYGPVAGAERLRAAAAGYWSRRSLPTNPDAVVAGPGSKALLFATLLALGTDIAVPRPSWVSYAAQATLIGRHSALRAGRAGRGRQLRPGGAGGSGPRQPACGPAHRCGARHPAGQPHWPAGKPGGHPGAVRRRRAE